MADAQASGACGSNVVWVQVPSPAFFMQERTLQEAPAGLDFTRSAGVFRFPDLEILFLLLLLFFYLSVAKPVKGRVVFLFLAAIAGEHTNIGSHIAAAGL